MSRAFWLLIVAALALAGCAEPRPVAPVVPQIVRVEVPVYVPVPEELTKDCPIAEPESLKVEQVVLVANQRKQALKDCNADKAAIRALGNEPAK